MKLLISLLQFILRRLGPYRVARIFHELRRKNNEQVDRLLEYTLNAEMPGRPLHFAFLKGYCADLFSFRSGSLALPVDESVGKLLSQIPTETSNEERRLLWHYFASMWDGQGDVIEIGPFLGGTSRAIVLGMMANPRFAGGKLLTYDRFEHYYKPDKLAEFVNPLKEAGLLSSEAIDRIGQTSSFLEIYKEIHGAHDYGKHVEPIARPLPGTAAEAEAGTGWFDVSADLSCTAFFVDGCKSWYGTKYFMRECCAVAQPCSRFIFQDYLQHTCFWLPAFVRHFSDCFRLLCYVDHTFVFELIRPLSPERIAEEFPDDPETWKADYFSQLFLAERQAAAERGHRAAEVRHSIQLGAALAYIGEKDLGRKSFAELLDDPIAEGFESFIRETSKTPTYRPHGSGVTPVHL